MRLCPTGDWHGLLMPIRRAAGRAWRRAGRLVIYRKGKPADPDDFRGVYRLGPAAAGLASAQSHFGREPKSVRRPFDCSSRKSAASRRRTVRSRTVRYFSDSRSIFDVRGYRGDVLLHQPAQAHLRCGFAVLLADPGQRLVVLDAALGDSGCKPPAPCRGPVQASSTLALVEIGMILDLIAYQRHRTGRDGLFDQRPP